MSLQVLRSPHLQQAQSKQSSQRALRASVRCLKSFSSYVLLIFTVPRDGILRKKIIFRIFIISKMKKPVKVSPFAQPTSFTKNVAKKNASFTKVYKKTLSYTKASFMVIKGLSEAVLPRPQGGNRQALRAENSCHRARRGAFRHPARACNPPKGKAGARRISRQAQAFPVR